MLFESSRVTLGSQRYCCERTGWLNFWQSPAPSAHASTPSCISGDAPEPEAGATGALPSADSSSFDGVMGCELHGLCLCVRLGQRTAVSIAIGARLCAIVCQRQCSGPRFAGHRERGVSSLYVPKSARRFAIPCAPKSYFGPLILCVPHESKSYKPTAQTSFILVPWAPIGCAWLHSASDLNLRREARRATALCAAAAKAFC